MKFCNDLYNNVGLSKGHAAPFAKHKVKNCQIIGVKSIYVSELIQKRSKKKCDCAET